MALPAAAETSPLYDNFVVLGALDCEIDGDVRLYVGADRALHCDFVPRGAPDRLKRYQAYISEIQPGLAVADNDFACWTVMQLNRDSASSPAQAKFTGRYSPAPAATIESYQLKDATLMGGGAQSFALEPRCVAPRMGKNLADKVLRIEIRD